VNSPLRRLRLPSSRIYPCPVPEYRTTHMDPAPSLKTRVYETDFRESQIWSLSRRIK
jgi:hypothetical protein